MHLLSVAHLQSSLLGGFAIAPTQKWWMENNGKEGFNWSHDLYTADRPSCVGTSLNLLKNFLWKCGNWQEVYS